MQLVDTILGKMSNLSKPQRKFIVTLPAVMVMVHGRKTFRNMSRYSDLSEKTDSRQFRKPFDFVEFNQLTIAEAIPPEATVVAAMDCHFTEKSGKHTYGVDRFYNSKHSKPERGLEVSELAIVDVDYNSAYHLSTRQTPALEKGVRDKEADRIDAYLDHLRQDRQALPASVRYLITDGYYSKKRFVDGMIEQNLHSVGKLRHDANLRYLYQESRKPKGRHRKYDGKVRLTDLSRPELVHHQDDLSIYTAVVNPVSLKRDIRIAYLIKRKANKVLTALLFSTDTALSAKEIYRFYKARFQIEFLFRDARRFTGPDDCQARRRDSLHFHFNASMSALNPARIEERQLATGFHVISVASYKIRKFNQHLLQRFSSLLRLDLTSIQSHSLYEELINYGVINA